jgi:hypothetical protein
MTEAEMDAVWDRFDKIFVFSPSVDSKNWPIYAEPTPSVTFDISHLWDIYRKNESVAENIDRDLHFKTLSAFRLCVPVDGRMYALDWNHLCYSFYPHRAKPEERWGVPVIPNGDYYIFIAEDFSFGTLGQPWETSICVFGQVLLDAIDQFAPLLFDRVLRRNGEPVDPPS